MKEDKFLEENIEKWDKLSNYNEKIKSKGMANLNKDEIQEFTDLYRATSHNLAYAQTNFPSSNIITYINQIIGTSHNYIFVREKTNYNGIKYYLTKGFTKAIHDNYKYILGSFLLFTFAMIFMIILVFINRDYGNIFYPNITGDMLNTDGDSIDSVLYPFLSSFIITNNIKVSFISFILGITGGVGTLYVLFVNGLNIGGLVGIVMYDGVNIFKFLSMILPHGIIELTAIFISCGAGLILGKGILIPNRLKRKDSIIKAGKEAIKLIPGIVVMLIIAGLIEGFFTPTSLNYIIKLIFSLITLILMIAYYNKYKPKE